MFSDSILFLLQTDSGYSEKGKAPTGLLYLIILADIVIRYNRKS